MGSCRFQAPISPIHSHHYRKANKMQRAIRGLRAPLTRAATHRALSSAAVEADLPPAAGVAGRYSQALYNAAKKTNTLDAVVADVDRMQALRDSSPGLNEFLLNPSLPRTAKVDTLTEIMDRESFSPTFKQFMLVLADNGRTPESAKILAAFREIMASVKGEVVVKVTSASEIGEWEMALLKKNIKTSFFKNRVTDLTVETAVDQELIGGLTIQVGDRFMDLSTRTELRKVQEEILKSVA